MTDVDSLKKLINENDFKRIVEVGVLGGSKPFQLLKQCQLERYFLIDPWVVYSGYPTRTQEGWDNLCRKVYSWFFDHDIVRIIRLPSVLACQLFKDESLDLVYIDANHLECQTDIDVWAPKVRKGGILAGHDWPMRVVRMAVWETFGNRFEELPGSVWAVGI